MKHFVLAAIAITAVMFSGAAQAKSFDAPMVVESPHVTASYDDHTFSESAFVVGVSDEKQAELPDTMVSEFSAAKDQGVISAPAAKSAPLEVSAPHGKMV